MNYELEPAPLYEHGSAGRAAICVDSCPECGPRRAKRREAQRAYQQRLKAEGHERKPIVRRPAPGRPAVAAPPAVEYEGRDEYRAHLAELFS